MRQSVQCYRGIEITLGHSNMMFRASLDFSSQRQRLD